MKMSFISTLVFGVSACLVGLPSEAQMSGASAPDQSYVAQLNPMNTNVTGQESSGEARFTISGDTLSISITAEDVPAGIAHLQHFHGFKDGADASCATQDDDTNEDGIIDVIETERVSGTRWCNVLSVNFLGGEASAEPSGYPFESELCRFATERNNENGSACTE